MRSDGGHVGPHLRRGDVALQLGGMRVQPSDYSAVICLPAAAGRVSSRDGREPLLQLRDQGLPLTECELRVDGDGNNNVWMKL